MQTVCYVAYYSTATASTSNGAVVPIVRAGRITAIEITYMAVGGAGNGFELVELVKNQAAGGTGQSTVNNPQRELVLATLQAGCGNVAVVTQRTMVDNISIPVAVGDNLNLGNVLQSGTAPTLGIASAKVYVAEG